jgi:hypothetical protein
MEEKEGKVWKRTEIVETTCDVCGKECSTLFSLRTNEGIIVLCSFRCFGKISSFNLRTKPKDPKDPKDPEF